MQSIGHYFCSAVLCGLCVNMAWWHFTWPVCGRLEKCDVLIRYKIQIIHTWHDTHNTTYSFLKYTWNVKLQMEHI